LDAEGAGFELPTGRDNFQCDIPGRDEDETPLTLDPYTDPSLPPSSDFDYDLPDSPDFDPTPAPPGGGFGGTGGPGNPEDPLEEDIPLPIQGASGPNGEPQFGDTLTLPEICPGMLTKWYLIPEDGGPAVQVSAGAAVPFLIGPELTGFSVYAEGCCPDPGAPGGFAQCVETDILPVIIPTGQYYNAREEGGTWQAFYVVNGEFGDCAPFSFPEAPGDLNVGINIAFSGDCGDGVPGQQGFLLYGDNTDCICKSFVDAPRGCREVCEGEFVMYYRGPEPGAVFEPVEPDFVFA
jgi:hypothetical protein